MSLLVYAPIAFVLTALDLLGFAVLDRSIVVGGAMLPDLDMRLSFVPHRGPTHTVWFALAVGAGLGLVGVFAGRSQGVCLAVALGAFGVLLGVLTVGAHLVADALTPMGASVPPVRDENRTRSTSSKPRTR